MIEADVEPVEALRPCGGNLRDQCFRGEPFGVRFQHDRCAVGVVGADEVKLVALHALEPHPDIGLDVFHDVADVKQPVRVGKRRRDEEATAAGRGGGTCGHREKPCTGQGKQ